MALLSTLVKERIQNIDSVTLEQNLERGEISVFYPATQNTTFRCEFCWKPPANGIAEIEIWGASGSGGRQCCCSASVAGNPGAYVKKTVEVSPSSFVSGIIGFSCGNADALCFRGCSQSTCVTICHEGGCTCLCAEGGFGGQARCAPSASAACCLGGQFSLSAHRLPNTDNGCNMVCNNPGRGRGFGGDINCCGGFSCVSFYHCNRCCANSIQDHIGISPGILSKGTSTLTFNRSSDRIQALPPGQGLYQLIGALNIAGRSPALGSHPTACWNGSRGCGCYEMWGCNPYLPYGVPGPSEMTCPNVRDSGRRGGHGAVRIKFIGF